MVILIEMFGISLGLTLVIEILVALLWKWKSKRQILLVVLTNILTNPAAVLLVWLGKNYLGIDKDIFLQIFVEVLVVSAEAWIYFLFSKEEAWVLPKPIGYAVIANGVSWFSGVVLQYFIY